MKVIYKLIRELDLRVIEAEKQEKTEAVDALLDIKEWIIDNAKFEKNA